ncbi:MAG: 16S rRNA (adenine(1518)-N(6)/adenine(1519)-N(6))-dimethyltransferase RsmA [bacterium]|nr:16S rRNA (adenine(1518)-N(6)/adenine(1519)-N(6))-dimethyltransferase RsmA [bacterium]
MRCGPVPSPMSGPVEVPLAPGAVGRRLLALGVRPSRRRGQSFIASPRAAAAIARAADLCRSDAVLEIGPGLGGLTAELLRRAGRVVAVESDARLAGWLRVLFAGRESFELVEGDALRVDLEQIFARLGRDGGRVKVVANIPYSISGPLIGRILESAGGVSLIALTVQDDLARRIAASPGGGEYGAFSVFCQYHAEVRKVVTLPPSAFHPRPGVVSAVVLFHPRARPPLAAAEEEAFFALVRLLFSERRKTVGTLLRRALRGTAASGRLAEVFAAAGVDPGSRAERLRIDQFESLRAALAAAGGTIGEGTTCGAG